MTPPLRAMFVISSTSQGGAERQSITLANRLLERGHECWLTCVKPAENALRLGDGNAARSLEARRYFDLAAVKRFGAVLDAAEPSIVVAVNPYALMYARLALRYARIRPRLVVTYHTTRLPSLRDELQTIVYRPLFWTADCAVFVCRQQLAYWRRRVVRSRRNEVIYNGVDTNTYKDGHDAADIARARRALGFAESDYVIGVSAWLRPEKNHVQLVDAITELRRRGLPAKALMIGDGAARAHVERRARELDVEDDVVITGATPDVRGYVALCDVMAILSTAVETFSLAALEAMAMAKPVVHSEIGGASEMIVPGHNGFTFPVGDTETLIRQLEALGDRSVSQAMGRNARSLVESRFSEHVMVDHYERLFTDLCAAGA